jgi:hypothetical protein
MRRAILLGLAICVLSAIPAVAAIQTGWTIDLSKVTGQGLTGLFTIPDVKELTYSGIGHQGLVAPGVLGIDAVFYATGIRDGIGSTESSTGEVLNGNGLHSPAFEITFVLHTTGVLTGVPGAQTQFVHLPGGTLDVYVQNITSGAGRANPSITTGGNGFDDGTLIATLVDMGPAGGGNIDYAKLDGDDNGVFLVVPGSGPDGVLMTADGKIDMLNVPSLDYPNVYCLALTDSNYHLDPDHNLVIDSGPPANWTAGWSRTMNGLTDLFFTEDGSASFTLIPEPATVTIWALLGICAVGLVRIRRKQ